MVHGEAAPPSPASGPTGVRARVGFSPNSPQQEAGMRIEPPPSLACASGTIPAATAAAAPPDEPAGRPAEVPGVAGRPRQAGLGRRREPQFGRRRLAENEDAGATETLGERRIESAPAANSAKSREPCIDRVPFIAVGPSFRRNGAPAKGALASRLARDARPSS